MKFHEFLRDRRLELNISQADVAAQIGMTGPQFLSNIERGLCPMPAKYIKGLGKCLKVKPLSIAHIVIEEMKSTYLAEAGLR